MNDSIVDLLRQLRDDTTQLIRDEVNLAKTEAREIGTRTLRNVAYVALGGAVALAGALVLLFGLAHWLSALFAERGMSSSASNLLGFLVVSLVVLAIGAGMLSKGLKTLSGSELKPTRTARSLREDKQWAKEKLS